MPTYEASLIPALSPLSIVTCVVFGNYSNIGFHDTVWYLPRYKAVVIGSGWKRIPSSQQLLQ